MIEKHSEVVARFDSYMKTSLKNCLYRIRLKNKKRIENEIYFDSEMLSYISVLEDFHVDENYIDILDFDLMIKNDLLFETLKRLDKHQRDIIYLSVCEGMSDREIGEYIKMSRQKVQRIKSRGMRFLKEMMIGEETYED